MNKLQLFLPVVLLLITACAENTNDISAKIESQFKANLKTMDLKLVSPLPWEQVCFLGPYTNNKSTEQILGFKWDSEHKTSIGSSDGINVLVFVRDHAVLTYTEHPRNKGDFSKLASRCLTKNNSTVMREPGNGDWVYLVHGINN